MNRNPVSFLGGPIVAPPVGLPQAVVNPSAGELDLGKYPFIFVSQGVPTEYSDVGFALALNDARLTGKRIKLHAGYIKLKNSYTVLNTGLQIEGLGDGRSFIFYEGAGTFLTVKPADVFSTVSLTQFDIIAWGPQTSSLVFDIAYPQVMSLTENTVKISVRVRDGGGTKANGWAKSWNSFARFTNIQNVNISESSFQGKADLYDTAGKNVGRRDGSFVVEINGGAYNLGLNLFNFRALYTQYGIKLNAYLEPLRAIMVDFVGIVTGISLPSTVPAGGALGLVRSASFWFTQCHMAVYDAGISADGLYDAKGTLNIQKYAASESVTPCVGLSLANCDTIKLQGESMVGCDVGAVLANTTNSYIEFHADNVGQAYYVAPNSARNRLFVTARGADDNRALNNAINLAPSTLTQRIFSDGSIVVEHGGVGYRVRNQGDASVIEAVNNNGAADAGLILAAQNNAGVSVCNKSGAGVLAQFVPNAGVLSPAAWVKLIATGAGNAPEIRPEGPSANVSMIVGTKGTGALVLGGAANAPIGFFGNPGQQKRVIGGARNSGSALLQLIAYLNDMGLIFDNTTGYSDSEFTDNMTAWFLARPTSPDGLGPNKFWRMGDAAGGYTLAFTGATT